MTTSGGFGLPGMSNTTPTASSSTTAGTTGSSSSSTTTNPNGKLGQNAFLQLLVEQMQNQDPLHPQSDTQMISQLAQFSALEQMTNVASTETQVLSAIQGLQSIEGMAFEHQLIGTKITVDDGSGNPVQGTVSAIKFDKGQPNIVVNGKEYPLTQVVQMS